MSVTDEKKIIAKSAQQVFNGRPSVAKYWDDKKESSIDILSSEGSPQLGSTSFCTIGLSSYSIGFQSEEKPLRIEFVAACASEVSVVPNILATCAFNAINSNKSCFPGAIFLDCVKMYVPNSEMRHMLFVSPFLWESSLELLNFLDKKVTWLLAVPISDQEFAYSQANGLEALEDLLEEKQIDLLDINRKSAI